MNRVLSLAFAIATLPGCYLASDGRDLERQVAAIDARQTEFLSTFEAERERLNELVREAERKVVELEAALKQAQDFLKRNNADLALQVEKVQGEIALLRGRLEELQHEDQRLLKEIELLRQDIDIRFGTLLQNTGGGR